VDLQCFAYRRALVALFLETVPLAVVFVIASALALLVNYPNPREQRERL
jgi:Mg2+/citrate symporter